MKTKILGVIAAGVMGVSLLAFGLPGGAPKTFDDCIIENMGNAQTKSAARHIYNSCSAKFHEAAPAYTKKDGSFSYEEMTEYINGKQ